MNDYKNGFIMEAMINRSAVNKDVTDWAEYHKHFKARKMTPYQLAVEVWNGYAFAPVCKNNRRKKSEFQAGWHVALDFDTQDERSSLEYIVNQDLANWFGSFAYSTPSSQPDKPKSRLVFVMMRPITDYEYYEDLTKAIIKEFGGADEACKDASRLFFGSKQCEVKGIWSYLPHDTIDFLVSRYREERELAREAVKDSVIHIPSGGDHSRYVAAIITGETDALRAAEKGTRHQALLKAGFNIGTLINAKWANVSYNDALSAIMSACGGWNNQPEVERVASDSLTAGMAEPRDEPTRTVLKPRGQRL